MRTRPCLATTDVHSRGTSDASDAVVQSRVFQHAQIVSAYPAQKLPNGTWERVCSGDTGSASGVVTNVVLVATQLRSDDGAANADKDASIRPGDVVADRVVNGGAGDIELAPVSGLGDLASDGFNLRLAGAHIRRESERGGPTGRNRLWRKSRQRPDGIYVLTGKTLGRSAAQASSSRAHRRPTVVARGR